MQLEWTAETSIHYHKSNSMSVVFARQSLDPAVDSHFVTHINKNLTFVLWAEVHHCDSVRNAKKLGSTFDPHQVIHPRTMVVDSGRELTT